MKKTLTYMLAVLTMLVATTFAAAGQIVTTQPDILQKESTGVVLTYHADSPLGNMGLAGLGSNAEIYAHIGLITSSSDGSGDWKYACTWGNNDKKYRLDYAGPDTWTLEIGDIPSYFGLTGETETVQKIALVFRTGDCNREGKTASGGDIFVDVLPSGFQISLRSDLDATVINAPTTATYRVYATAPAELDLSVNGKSIATASAATSLEKSYTFDARGSYDIVATAKADGQTLTATSKVVFPISSVQSDYPGGIPVMGPVDNADGSVTFCIAAPGKNSAVLVPSWDDYAVLDSNSMYYQDYEGSRYFWIKVAGIDRNTYSPYYFLIDGQRVGDPYARLVLDPWSDKWIDQSIWPDMPKYPYDRFSDVLLAVYCGDMHRFDFSEFEIPPHHNLIVYEMLLRDFTGTEGQAYGNGTLRGAIEKIPYLKRLGVNAVELMPIMEFNGNNSWGYNTNFYFAPDKAYGSPLEYKEFIEECHRNGIAVILDVVFNQSDGLHPWYQMYPISSNPFYNAKAPHDYSVLNDWRQDNALVQKQWEDVLRYWMTEYNVDGYRFDLVKGLGDNDSYRSGTEAYNSSRVRRMKHLQDVIKSVKPDGIHINEHLAGDREENEMASTGQINWSNVNYGAGRYAQGNSNGAADIKGFYAPNWNRTWGSTVSYMESHDEERVAYLQKSSTQAPIKNNHDLRMRRLGSLAVQMLITPGPKMIWQFGELGADESTKSPNGGNNTSPKKVIWSYLDDADRAALMHTYQEMCGMRTLNPDLFAQDAVFEVSDISGFSGRTYRVASADKEAVVFVNSRIGGTTPASVSTNASLLRSGNAKLMVASKDYDGTLESTGNVVSVMLKPNEYAVYATSDVSGIEGVTGDNAATTATVRGGIGEIIVTGEYRTLEVFDLRGMSYGNRLTVPAGMYVVSVDGTHSKVIVR